MYPTHENNIIVAYTVCECDNFETLARVKSWVPGRCLTKENSPLPPFILLVIHVAQSLGALCSVSAMQ